MSWRCFWSVGGVLRVSGSEAAVQEAGTWALASTQHAGAAYPASWCFKPKGKSEIQFGGILQPEKKQTHTAHRVMFFVFFTCWNGVLNPDWDLRFVRFEMAVRWLLGFLRWVC